MQSPRATEWKNMTIALIDERACEEPERSLLKYGYHVIRLPASRHIPAPMASHADMLMLVHGDRIITSVEYCDEASYVFSDVRYYAPNTSIRFADEIQRHDYPYDAIYNALIIGKRIFCKTDTVARAVLEHADSAGLKVIHVKQGYPACTVLPLSDDAAITSDKGMASAMEAEGIRVTLVDDSNVSLPPYEHGFIGGAAGVHGNHVYFLGDLDTHTNAERIKNACREEGLTPISLGTGALVDLGRIIFIDAKL